MARHRRHGRYGDSGRAENEPAANGFDLSSLGSIAGLLNNIDMNKISSLLGNISTSLPINTTGNDGSRDSNVEQRKSDLANALRTLINADKSELLQVALQIYAATKNNQSNIRDNP